jgi:hypothetical protein
MVLSTVFAVLAFSGSAAYGQSCQPDIDATYFKHNVEYGALFSTLSSQGGSLQTELAAVKDQTTYATLLSDARKIAASIPTGRLVITLPDGTVVLDTSKTDDPDNTMPSGNSFQHLQTKTVNENHNTRVAIMAAQSFPCGVGLERKFSTTDGTIETYVAFRLGLYLDSIGTARISLTSK